jgi:GNAT superfamily N-acetyltransferase
MSIQHRDVHTGEIHIRPAIPNDAAAACQVLCRSITESCQQDHHNHPDTLKAWLGNKNPDSVAAWFTTPANHALVAEQGGQVVGIALLTQAGKLSLCYVLPEAQGKGIGKALLQGLEAQARSWGIGTIKMNSTATASGFFAHHGYSLGGREKSCFGLECDFLWKQLDGEAAGARAKRFCNCGS